MAVGLNSLPMLHSIEGIRLGTTEAGFKKAGHRDLVIIELAEGSNTAAVFTQNAFRAAPVTVAQQHLASTSPRFLLINSGNANAGTGAQGIADTNNSCDLVGAEGGCDGEQVLPFSTGVIGEPLPMEPMRKGIPQAFGELSEIGWADAAQAIITTDTVAKGASNIISVGDQTLRVTGIAKGSGMIHPNMATMLAYIATDADVPGPLLQDILNTAVAASFNRITVDGDTSTNDACVLMATGKGQLRVSDSQSDTYHALLKAVLGIAQELAREIIRDAEGATKFITVEVVAAASDAEADQVAYTVAQSPLVKTAFFGNDANWGRILAAVGRAGVEQLEVNKVDIALDEYSIVLGGARNPDYEEEMGEIVMSRPEITVRIDLHRGTHSAHVWTSDLSIDYVKINAEYRS